MSTQEIPTAREGRRERAGVSLLAWDMTTALCDRPRTPVILWTK